MANKNNNKKQSFLEKLLGLNSKTAPNSAQTTIPFVRVYDDTYTKGGIIETVDGTFTKSYIINDTNYSDAGEEKQEEILKIFEKILSTFSVNVRYQFTVNNRTVDQEEFNKKVLINYQNDDYDKLRAEHNELVLEMIQEGKNNLKAEKYLTIAVNAENIREAMDKFAAIEKDLDIKIKKINQVGLEVISLKDRLEILHDIYNNGQEGTFSSKFSLDDMVKQGISPRDAIAPMSFDFSNPSYIKIDDKYVRVLALKSIPSRLVSTIMEKLSQVSTNTIISATYEIQPQDKAAAFASANVTNVGSEVVQAQKNLSKAGASPDLISPRLQIARDDAKEMLDSITNGNNSLFHVTLTAIIYADTKEDLNLYTEQLKTRAKEQLCVMDILRSQQEQGFNTAIPLAQNLIKMHRVMTTNSAAAIQPFSTQELQIKNGYYYGLNQQSKNVIIYNRGWADNQNGVILGSPGKGKSFAAKMEMYQAFLNTKNTQIFIIDPEREYVSLAKELGGTVFSITARSEYHINPLDLNIAKNKDDQVDPFAQKVDFVISIVESMLGGRAQLNGYLKSIIDNTLQNLYAPYLQHLNKTGKNIDVNVCPTLKDFYDALKGRKEPEARNLADSISMYCIGSMNLFAHSTNINTNNRMIIYDTKNMQENMKELGMQICLNDIWNRMMENKTKNIRTLFYVDEFYLLLRQPSSAQYLQMIWKRARKWMGTPTGITQNVSDLINSPEGETILSTSDFALILGQPFSDKVALAALYHLSDEQQEYIEKETTGPGEGLLYTSRSVVPFENHVPTNSPIYKLLSTKAEDAEIITERNVINLQKDS